MITRKGTTRIVFIFNSFVVKIPNFTYSWHQFVLGIVCNLNEYKAWEYNRYDPESQISNLICPVRWCSWGGWILIMERAEPLPKMDYTEFIRLTTDHELLFPGDRNKGNYGIYKDRIVKIDYAQ